jgi:hypothetical protein
VRDVIAFLEVAPQVAFDCMLEAKEKIEPSSSCVTS